MTLEPLHNNTGALIACLVCLDSGVLTARGDRPCPECARGDWTDDYDGWIAPFQRMLARVAATEPKP